MQSATDSFIQYLSTGLGDNLRVAYMRATSVDPTSNDLQLDALNVSVIAFIEKGSSEYALVSLDIIGTDERQVMAWAKVTRDLLLDRQYIPEYDYEANPLDPVPMHRCVSWDARDITFAVVASSARAVHVNATFELLHVRHSGQAAPAPIDSWVQDGFM